MVRTVLSVLLGLVAVVLLLGGVTATAVQRTVVDPDGFTALTTPLSADPGVRDRLASTAAAEVTNRLSLPGALRDAAAGLIDKAAVALTEDPGFPGAWERSMRRSHDLSLSSLTDPARTDVLQADIQPLVKLLADQAAGAFGVPLGGSVVGSDPVVLDVGAPGQARLAGIVVRATGYAPAALVGAAVVAVLALLLAHRRTTTLAWLGVGVLFGTGLLVLAGVMVRGAVASGANAPALADYLRYRVVDLAAGAAVPWLVGLAVWGAVLLAVGVVGRLVVGRPVTGSAQR
ncbi:hypothetical protein BKD30_14385 [Tersicoccus phoenicis]|uniref:Uncharacterized protein n=1 Tax=Tersicoccus phoenicis TaxID=554083 RepID=A0A1R1L6A4_9MICC|nr:hypothetical protein [Tersicoccus phoenicis]OMH23060.1 hypothetical protein BKD30_14385 [Tersicoccus phoenicis]